MLSKINPFLFTLNNPAVTLWRAKLWPSHPLNRPLEAAAGPHTKPRAKRRCHYILAFLGYPQFLAHTGCIPFFKPQADGRPLLWTLGLLDMMFQVQKSKLSQGHQSRTASDEPWTFCQSPIPSTSFSSSPYCSRIFPVRGLLVVSFFFF